MSFLRHTSEKKKKKIITFLRFQLGRMAVTSD